MTYDSAPSRNLAKFTHNHTAMIVNAGLTAKVGEGDFDAAWDQAARDPNRSWDEVRDECIRLQVEWQDDRRDALLAELAGQPPIKTWGTPWDQFKECFFLPYVIILGIFKPSEIPPNTTKNPTLYRP